MCAFVMFSQILYNSKKQQLNSFYFLFYIFLLLFYVYILSQSKWDNFDDIYCFWGDFVGLVYLWLAWYKNILDAVLSFCSSKQKKTY